MDKTYARYTFLVSALIRRLNRPKSGSVRSNKTLFVLMSANMTAGVTNNVITSQVATTLLRGLFPSSEFSSPSSHIVYVQSSSIDSLEPSYSCPVADSLINSYTSAGGPTAVNWTNHLAEAQNLYAALDKVSGIQNPDNAGWHTSFDQYVSRILKAK